MNKVKHNSGNCEWYTPPAIMEVCRAALDGHIDIDPASCAKANEIVQADIFYTKEDDGLSKNKKWHGRVFLNPPYRQPDVSLFVDKLIHAKKSRYKITFRAILLVNNATDTKWFQKALQNCDLVCFPKRRIRFLDADLHPQPSPLHGNAIFYFGDDYEDFAHASKTLSKLGVVLQHT